MTEQETEFLTLLEAEIRTRQNELNVLIRARDVLKGSHTPPAPAPTNGHRDHRTDHQGHNAVPATVADAVERILNGNGAGGLHITKLLTELQGQYGMQTTPKNLINTLNRWVSRKKRFSRPKPNTFALVHQNGTRRHRAS